MDRFQVSNVVRGPSTGRAGEREGSRLKAELVRVRWNGWGREVGGRSAEATSDCDWRRADQLPKDEANGFLLF